MSFPRSFVVSVCLHFAADPRSLDRVTVGPASSARAAELPDAGVPICEVWRAEFFTKAFTDGEPFEWNPASVGSRSGPSSAVLPN